MAPFPRGLAFFLTFWVVAWPAASTRTGSLPSGWWGTQEAIALRQAVQETIRNGDFAGAERVYQRGADLSAQHHNSSAAAWFLNGVGSARFSQFDYRGALDAYLKARHQAEVSRDRTFVGGVDLNLASLYQQIWDFSSAGRSVEEAGRLAQGLDVYYQPQLLLQRGRLAGGPGSISLYRQGIKAAHAASVKDHTQIVVEARGLDLLGEALLANGDEEGGRKAAASALVLRQQSAPRDLGFSYWRLGAERLKEHSLQEAESLTLRAMQASMGPPAYVLEDQLGRILLEQGRVEEALRAMELAVAQAQRWRVGIAPSLTAIDGVTSELGKRIFEGFIKTAVDYGLLNRSQRWIEEGFQAAELNRALDFQNAAQSESRHRLPIEYWETLAKIKGEDTKLARSESIRTGPTSISTSTVYSQEAQRLQMRLTEIEAQAGLGSPLINAENFPTPDSLSHFCKRLRDSEVLLSFGLGKEESFLWAVTRNSLHVYRLPPADRIREAVREFRQAIEAERAAVEGMTDGAGRIDERDLGGKLYEMLFGQLQASEASKSAWLVSPEDALLELPFAALVPERKQRTGKTKFLVERHSLQMISGALLPQTPLASLPKGFLSVGDPIYNMADPRWKTGWKADWTAGWRSGSAASWFWTRFTGDPGNQLQLNRLPGTRREVEASAAAWGSGASTRVLEGAQATSDNFKASLMETPAVIHLATHALTPASGAEAYLAFSLGRNGQLEMLSTSEIQTLQVPGSIVVMTGCATAPSDVRTGVGLAGLVRAWTIAGARAVVATEWRVSDNSGNTLLSSFYRYLRENPDDVAEALRSAQVEAIHSAEADGRTSAASWSAYQAFGNRTVRSISSIGGELSISPKEELGSHTR